MEKDSVSISTVQLKPDYAASEVYSTVSGSEPPPAYKMRPSNAVQIAKIISVAVIVSSLIFTCGILASSYIQARAACDQMQAIDTMLGKELMLETLQDLPKPEALEAKAAFADDNQLKEENHEKIDEASTNDQQGEDTAEENTDDLSNDAEKVHIRMPMELDLSDLAGALLLNHNQQSRMNCVVERRRTEEVVDSPAKMVQLPFGMNVSTDPKKQKITGERIAIFCDNGKDEKKEQQQPSEGVPRVVAMHVNAIPIHFRPQQFPITHMPFQQQQINPQVLAQQQAAAAEHHQMHHQMPQFRFGSPQPQQAQNQFQSFRQIPLPLQPLIRQIQQSHMNEFQRQEPEVRIQLQRIAVPIPSEEREEMPMPQQQQPQQPHITQITPQVQVHRIPLADALQRAGITADDLKNIQRMAEQRIQQELRELAAEDDSSNEEDDSSEENRPHPLPLAYGRMAYGRSLAQPVNLPGPMPAETESTQTPAEDEQQQPERPHYVQPRSV